jgi:hypothetical protein
MAGAVMVTILAGQAGQAGLPRPSESLHAAS